ncbi:hypothetical protein C8Q72DRAFT_880982 [Fomitopsis betulina]|nr:hypothetical protein C8Q72DRAFT_880982 [Fomitopsis betulina]
MSYLRDAHLLINVAPERFSCVASTWGFYHRPQLIELRTHYEELDEEQWFVYIEQQPKRVKAIQEMGHIPFMPQVSASRVFLSMPLRVCCGLMLGRRPEELEPKGEFKGVLRSKLRDIGWGREVDMLDPEDEFPLSKNKRVKGNQEINEDTWHKEWDEERRKIMREWLETLREMYRKKRGAAGYDESTEHLPNFKGEARDFDVEALERLFDQLPTFDTQWIDYQQEMLAKLLKAKM